MPENCRTDVAAAAHYIDNLMTTGSASRSHGDQGAIRHGESRTTAVQHFNGRSTPGRTFNLLATLPTMDNQTFYKFCDAIEGGNANSPATGVGLPTALNNWAACFQTDNRDSDCPTGSCYATYSYPALQYTDTTVSDKYGRGWAWSLCTEFGWFQGMRLYPTSTSGCD